MWFLSYYQTADQDTIYTTGGYNNRLLLFMTLQPLSIVHTYTIVAVETAGGIILVLCTSPKVHIMIVYYSYNILAMQL